MKDNTGFSTLHVDGKIGKTQKTNKKKADDADKMRAVLEKCASGKIGKELLSMDPYKCNLLCVDKKWWDQVDGRPIGHFQ